MREKWGIRRRGKSEMGRREFLSERLLSEGYKEAYRSRLEEY